VAKSRPQDGIDNCATFSVHVGKSNDHTAGTYVTETEVSVVPAKLYFKYMKTAIL
jgi:hypothetical protein